MKAAFVALVGAVLFGDSPPPANEAVSFVDEFSAICLASNGDFDSLKKSVKAAGFKKKHYLDQYPKSLLAQRDSITVVYRGDSAGPNCSLQSDRIPGSDIDKLVNGIEQRLGLSGAITSTNCNGRPVWRWQAHRQDGDKLVMLIDDVLVGEPNLSLVTMPWSEPKPEAQRVCVEPKVMRVDK